MMTVSSCPMRGPGRARRASPTASSYMTIESPVDDQLVAVSVPADVAATVEMHETVVGDATGATGPGPTT